MSFADDMRIFVVHAKTREQDAFVGIVAGLKDSIVLGSSLTGAPGQVVADINGGELRDSWQIYWNSPTEALISTGVPWSNQNEDGIARPSGGPYRQLAATGGRWNVALTIAGAQRVVDSVVAQLGDGAAAFGKDYSESLPSGFSDGASA